MPSSFSFPSADGRNSRTRFCRRLAWSTEQGSVGSFYQRAHMTGRLPSVHRLSVGLPVLASSAENRHTMHFGSLSSTCLAVSRQNSLPNLAPVRIQTLIAVASGGLQLRYIASSTSAEK